MECRLEIRSFEELVAALKPANGNDAQAVENCRAILSYTDHILSLGVGNLPEDEQQEALENINEVRRDCMAVLAGESGIISSLYESICGTIESLCQEFSPKDHTLLDRLSAAL